MNIAAWNVRGIGGTDKSGAVKKVVKKFNLGIIGLTETKHSKLTSRKVTGLWGIGDIGVIDVKAIEKSGGLILLYDKNALHVTDSEVGERWISVRGRLVRREIEIHVVLVYGYNTDLENSELWKQLEAVIPQDETPLVIMGDFNEILRVEDRKGCNRLSVGSKVFCNWIQSLGLTEIQLKGKNYTWYRVNSMSKIDKFIVNAWWLSAFPMSSALIGSRYTSDHNVIVLRLSAKDWGPTPFRTLNVWFTHSSFQGLVETLWSELGEIAVHEKLKGMKTRIKQWNKEIFGNIDSRIDDIDAELQQLDRKAENQSLTDAETAKQKGLQIELQNWFNRKGQYWAQLARNKIISDKDRNTRYFHVLASSRKKKQMIERLRIGSRVFKEPRSIREALVTYFEELYTKDELPEMNMDGVQLPYLSEEKAESLENPPTMEEIERAVLECDVNKAPGFDGYNMFFIRKCWHFMKYDFAKEILNFFETRKMPRPINTTWVTLVPKEQGAIEVDKLRPISMVGCLYKIIAKILSNRLKGVIHELVGETQTAFIHGRQILDGALIANEAVHWLKKKRRKGVLLKLDIQKAYDSVNWDFLERTMRKIGFGDRWIGWIMECVSTARISLIVNGVPTKPFTMQKGLRQGDPISPLLFVLCMEVFNRSYQQASENQWVHGLEIGKARITLTHLQFADDLLLFCHASTNNVNNVCRLLLYFYMLSGMKINFSKTELVTFGKSDKWVKRIAKKLHCKTSTLPIRYLGIPLGANPRRMSSWLPVIEKIRKRLEGWKSKLLSRGGRLTLIRSVLNSLPTYYLCLFKMPKSVMREIIRLQRNFLWSHDGVSKGTPLIRWENVQKPKEQGGLGVGDLTIRNAALLFKWWWRYSREESPLWKRVINSIHGQERFAASQKPLKTGGPWEGIHKALTSEEEFMKIIEKGFRWKLRNGDKVKFWEDKWCGDLSLKETYPTLFVVSLQQNNSIREMRLWNRTQWSWTFLWRRELWDWEKEELEGLQGLVQSANNYENKEDIPVWNFDDKGEYTTKSFNWTIWEARGVQHQQANVLTKCWQRIAPLRVEILVWLAIQGRLNTRDRLAKFGIIQQEANICNLCGEQNETTQHVFISCNLAATLWHEAKQWWGVTFVMPGDLLLAFESWMSLRGVGSKIGSKGWKTIFFVILDLIWNARNLCMFEGKKRKMEVECSWMKVRTMLWLKSSTPEISYGTDEMVKYVEMVKWWRKQV